MDPDWREHQIHPDPYTRDPVLRQDHYSTDPSSPQSPQQHYPMDRSPHFMREQGHPYFGPSHNQPPYKRDDWDCHNCDRSFFTELERDHHMHSCMQMLHDNFISVVEVKEPFYESIDNPPQLPTVLLFWNKERATLEKEIQLFTQDGRAIKLFWSDLAARFQTETQMSAGEHDGLLIVDDINLTADVHSFYVAPTQIGAKMQKVELAIDDEKEIAKEVTEAVVGEKGGEEKLKKPNLKERFAKFVLTDGEAAAKELPIDNQKKVKSLLKENEKLATELRDKSKKWSEDNIKLKKQMENIHKTGEAKREQLEKENHALHETNKALRKEFQQKARKQDNGDTSLKNALGKCKSQLELRETQNTDLTRQLSTIQMIAGINEDRVRDQQDEVVEKREKVTVLEDVIDKLRQELTVRDDWQQEWAMKEQTLQNEAVEANLQLDGLKKELNKSRIICDSLREETDKLRGELLLKKELPVTVPDQKPMEGATQELGLKEQLERVLKERDELILINRATKLDLENVKDQLRLEIEHKTEIKMREKVTPDPEISKFFQNTIKRKDEELEEMKRSLTKLREYNLRIDKEKQLYYEQLESYRGSLIPALRNQIQNLHANQLASKVCLSEINSPSAPLELHSLNSPVGQNDSPLFTTQPKPLGALSLPTYQTDNRDLVPKQKLSLTPNIPDSSSIRPTLFNIQNLPPPLHIQKQTNTNK